MQSTESKIVRANLDVLRLWEESERLVASCRDSAPLDCAAAIAAICRSARDLSAADGACVILREGELVHYAQEDTVAPLWAGQKFPIGNCISGWSILHRQQVVIEDIYQDQRIPIEYYRDTFVRSLAMQPVAPRNPIGAIGVYWKRRHRATAYELVQLEKLAEVAAIVLDNSQLREQVQRIEAEARAERDQRDDFLAAVSHELRSPLDAILGWVTILRRTDANPAAAARALEVIERNVKSQARLIEDLVDASRINSGKLNVDLSPVDIESVLRAAADASCPAALTKNIHLAVDIPAVGAIRGDGHRLQQVVRNVLANAIKFTPDGGHVRIAAERTDAHVTITVADSGIGIRADLLPHVFDRYRQADESSARRRSGLGLGLTIARQIVEMHGGDIRVDSDGEGHGTTVTIRLPAAAVASSA